MKTRTILLAAILAVLIGAGIMAYPFVAEYVNAKSQSEVVDDYVNASAQLGTAKKDELLATAAAYNEKLSNNTAVMTDPFDEESAKLTSEEYNSALRITAAGPMAVIDIKKIAVHLPIYHGTGAEALAKGVGHLQGTSLPLGGVGTHSVLSAHTGLAGAKLFTDLGKLTVGDTFTVTVLGDVLTYEVYGTEVVLPTELDSLRIDKSRDLVTLITCTPYGVNTHRLLVHAERVPTPDSVTASGVAQDGAPALPMAIIAFAAGVLAVVVMLALLAVRYSRRGERGAL